jgi:hypothetical protein
MIAAIIFIAIFVVTVAGMWRTFTKAGRSGWEALIPVYNIYVMLKIGGLSGWWVTVYILPIIPYIIGLLTSTASAQTTVSTTSQTGTTSFSGATTSFTSGGTNIPLEQVLGVGQGVAATLAIVLVFTAFAFFQLMITVNVVLTYNLARSFKKGVWFTWGLIMLPFIFWPILGFGNADYHGPVVGADELA